MSLISGGFSIGGIASAINQIFNPSAQTDLSGSPVVVGGSRGLPERIEDFTGINLPGVGRSGAEIAMLESAGASGAFRATASGGTAQAFDMVNPFTGRMQRFVPASRTSLGRCMVSSGDVSAAKRVKVQARKLAPIVGLRAVRPGGR